MRAQLYRNTRTKQNQRGGSWGRKLEQRKDASVVVQLGCRNTAKSNNCVRQIETEKKPEKHDAQISNN